MKLLILVVALYGMKLFELKFMEDISWWWINGIGFFAFLWFEFFERMLGLDKRQDDKMHEKMRKERLKRTFNDKSRRK
jgi:small Trp-rich protein